MAVAFEPSPPKRSDDGKIVAHDHPDILDDHYVIRHIVPPHDLHTEASTNITRVASGAFSESSDGGMSVDILAWMIADGLHELYYVNDEGDGAVKIRVGDLRERGFKVGWDPDGGHRHHGAVWGISTTGQRRFISKSAITIRKAVGET